MKIKLILLVVGILLLVMGGYVLLAWPFGLFIEFFWNKVLMPAFGLNPMPFLLAWGISFLGLIGAVVTVIIFLNLFFQPGKETEKELLERS